MRMNIPRKLPIPYKYIVIASLLICLILVLQNYVSYLVSKPDYEFGWSFSIVTSFTYVFIWTFFAPLIYRVSLKFMSYNRRSFRKIIHHIFMGIFFAASQILLASLLRSIILWVIKFKWFNPVGGHSLQSITVGIFSSFLEYWIILGLFIAANYYKKFRDKENELNNAQLNALKMQLHPHFLFNTLHTISSLIDENKTSAQAVISKLGFLLRSMLEQNKKHTFTLKEELEYIKSYLDIEEIRFQDRLKIKYDIEPGTLNALVPSLILQPLVENAIKHGFQNKFDSCLIKVISKIENNFIILIVEDNGVSAGNNKNNISTGIGLQNVKDRLEKLYGENYTFKTETNSEGGFTAVISFPLKTIKEKDKN